MAAMNSADADDKSSVFLKGIPHSRVCVHESTPCVESYRGLQAESVGVITYELGCAPVSAPGAPSKYQAEVRKSLRHDFSSTVLQKSHANCGPRGAFANPQRFCKRRKTNLEHVPIPWSTFRSSGIGTCSRFHKRSVRFTWGRWLRPSNASPCVHPGLHRRAESRPARTGWTDRWRGWRRPGKAAGSHGRSSAWCADRTSA